MKSGIISEKDTARSGSEKIIAMRSLGTSITHRQIKIILSKICIKILYFRDISRRLFLERTSSFNPRDRHVYKHFRIIGPAVFIENDSASFKTERGVKDHYAVEIRSEIH